MPARRRDVQRGIRCSGLVREIFLSEATASSCSKMTTLFNFLTISSSSWEEGCVSDEDEEGETEAEGEEEREE